MSAKNTWSRKVGLPLRPGRVVWIVACVALALMLSMGNALHWILVRLVAYLAVAIAAGLLFLAGATVYQLMWPRPVIPLSQMGNSP